MGEYIRLVANPGRAANSKREIRVWEAYLADIHVGRIEHCVGAGYRGGDYEADVFDRIDPSAYGWTEPRARSVGHYRSLYAAKVGMLEEARAYVRWLGGERVRKAPAAFLPSGDYQFYPTPSALAGRLLQNVNIYQVNTVLEPSAGKGDLLECVKQRKNSRYDRRFGGRFIDHAKLDIDCIEIDSNLQAILVGKGYRVVHDDFLSFVTRKRYDLVVMNPPFSEGDLHLIHAIELCENGGQIACILNAETLRNPCNNNRRLLAKKLREVGATVRFVDDAFARAERAARVDVALVNISIPRRFADDTIWENLQRARQAESVAAGTQPNALAPKDNIERMIIEHDLMVDAGISLMRMYNGIAPRLSVGSECVRALITLNVGGTHSDGTSECTEEHVNAFLTQVRAHFWGELFDLPDLRTRMTSDMRKQYGELIDEMCEYEFSRFNIRQVVERIMGQITVGIEEAIAKCFEKLSAEHAYNENLPNENVHYYNGWKSNKAHYVNMRCIIPTWGCFATEYRQRGGSGFERAYSTIAPNGCFGILSDLEKALNYLDKGETSDIDMMAALEAAKAANRNRNIVCKYFTVTFFKKGTCHIRFHERRIVDRLNIYIGRTKAWLPPCYGRVRYDEMDDESRRVVDEFQGRDAYEQVMANAGDYLIDVKAIPLLTA